MEIVSQRQKTSVPEIQRCDWDFSATDCESRYQNLLKISKNYLKGDDKSPFAKRETLIPLIARSKQK